MTLTGLAEMSGEPENFYVVSHPLAGCLVLFTWQQGFQEEQNKASSQLVTHLLLFYQRKQVENKSGGQALLQGLEKQSPSYEDLRSHVAYCAENLWSFLQTSTMCEVLRVRGLLGAHGNASNPFISDGMRESKPGFLQEMMSKLKPQEHVAVSQLNGGLGKIMGFPPSGKTKCKGLEVKSTFVISHHSLQQQNGVGDRDQNTNTIVVRAKKIGFVLRTIESYR